MKRKKEPVRDENFKKVMILFRKSRTAHTYLVEDVSVSAFSKYLHRVSEREALKGKNKFFIISKTGKRSVSVFCTAIRRELWKK